MIMSMMLTTNVVPKGVTTHRRRSFLLTNTMWFVVLWILNNSNFSQTVLSTVFSSISFFLCPVRCVDSWSFFFLCNICIRTREITVNLIYQLFFVFLFLYTVLYMGCSTPSFVCSFLLLYILCMRVCVRVVLHILLISVFYMSYVCACVCICDRPVHSTLLLCSIFIFSFLSFTSSSSSFV